MDIRLPPILTNCHTRPVQLPPLREMFDMPLLLAKTPIRAGFINLMGKSFPKRHRRRYNEVHRIYKCDYPGCTKAYGALNHLNAHIRALGHGRRRRARDYYAALAHNCIIISH